jgi:hypothetical protein
MKKHHKQLSRYFPKGHIKEGQPTFFVEKVNKGLGWEYGIPFGDETELYFKKLGLDYSFEMYKSVIPKYHTIRAGNNVKVGDQMRFFVWVGKPYRSKQIIVTPYFEVKQVWDFECTMEYGGLKIMTINGLHKSSNYEKLATNDGFKSINDLMDWFDKPFKGQLISWADHITY